MRREQTDAVRDVAASRGGQDGAPIRRLPQRTKDTTKQMHRRLLRALSDRRIKRAFD
jgi:hypothetical protein